jgi:uncharacterized protein
VERIPLILRKAMFKITRKSDLITNDWAGGTTTQLAIYPASAEYQKFNFDFRISFATVAVESSTFTFMPGVTRHLLMLDGRLFLEHVDRYNLELNKFDQTTFSGEWETKAQEKVTDFNLMTRGAANGKLEYLRLEKGKTKNLELTGENHFLGIYLPKGKLKLESGDEISGLHPGDFCFHHGIKSSPMLLTAEEHSDIIISWVKTG